MLCNPPPIRRTLQLAPSILGNFGITGHSHFRFVRVFTHFLVIGIGFFFNQI